MADAWSYWVDSCRRSVLFWDVPLEPVRVRRFREVEAALGVKLEEILAAGQPTRTAEREKLRKAVGTGVAANAVAATEARAGTTSATKRTAARRAKRPAQRRST